MSMRLSALDLTPVLAGETATDAIDHSICLARHLDAMGLSRIWLAEHHNAASVASANPELLVARVGAATERIRVGAGGIMLPNHSALKVAETFRLLHAMFPDRVDLGLGRAPGTDRTTAAALRRGMRYDKGDLLLHLDELLAYLGPDEVPRPPFAGTTVAIPTHVPAPSIFILSSSGFGAELAARRGLGLAFAHHMNPEEAPRAVRRYRETFQPSEHFDRPYAIVSASVVCAPNDAEAQRLRTSGDVAMLRFAQGRRDLPLPAPEDAVKERFGPDEDALRALYGRAPIVGAPDAVGDRLRALADATGADELMLLTMVYDQQARRRSYDLVAEALRSASRAAS